MKAIILCAGLGTRLRPLTFSTAKHLLPVANKAVLHFAIESLVEVGATEIGIIVSTESRPVIQTAIGDGARFGAHVSYIDQPEPRGLAHACGCAAAFIGDDPFIMYLGDNLLPEGMIKAMQRFRQSGANALVVLKSVDDPRGFGVAEIEGDHIVRLVEKPGEPKSNLAIVGSYVFDRHIWESIRRIKPSWRDEYEITDAIQDLIDHGFKVVPYIAEGWWKDTGQPSDILDANRAMLDELQPLLGGSVDAGSRIDGTVSIAAGATVIASTIHGPAIIGCGARVENAELGPYVSLGDRVQVSNATVTNCVIMDDSEVRGLHAPLVDSLIGRNVKIRGKTRGTRLLLGDSCEAEV